MLVNDDSFSPPLKNKRHRHCEPGACVRAAVIASDNTETNREAIPGKELSHGL